MIAPDSTLYFEYCTEESWTSPISIDYERVDYSSLEVVYDYDYLLKPRYDDWYGEIIENSDFDYEIIQYYSESFTVYDNASEYTHTFEIDYDFDRDFVNLSLFKIVGLYANFTEKFIEDDQVNFSVNINFLNKQITITDLDPSDGTLNSFDLITIVLNFTCGPISTSSQIILSQHFNSSFLEDMEETFYDSLSISFDHSARSGIYLFDERSDEITSELTSFTSIDYTRNTHLSNNNELTGFGDTVLFEEFIVFYDPYNVIYEADPNMDGIKDYKHEIDIDRDGRVDITRFGVEIWDNDNYKKVLWHTIVQDFEEEESYYHSQVGEKLSTEWFDIRDDIFASYEFKLNSLIALILGGSTGAIGMSFTIAHFVLPDMDYWAQKSVSQNQITYGITETNFYSVLTDNDRDGNADVQMAFKKSKTVVYSEIESTETTIIAAKPQDPWIFLCEYVEDSWNAIWGNARKEDRVFNSKLTEERLDNDDYSSLYTPEIASALDASYKKFTKITTKSFVDEEIEEQITISEWEDGEFVETRIYLDAFESEYFDSSELMTIIDLDSGQEIELPIGYSPSLLNNSREGWGRDGVPEKFDQVFIISPDQEVELINIHQETITINIPSRFSPYHDHRKVSQKTAVQDTSFEVTGVLIAPADGQVFYTSDKKAFKSGKAKTQGLLFYFDSDLDNFYETVYMLAPDYDNDGVYDVMTIGYNSDNKHSFAPYEKVDVSEPIINRDDYEQHISTETTQYGDNWVYNFAKLKNVETLFPKETYDGYEPKDDLFEVWKLVKKSDKNSKFSQLFYEVRHKEYDKTWSDYSEYFWRDVGDQVFATLVASSISFAIIASSIGLATPLAHIAYFVAYSAISKFQMDMKAKEAEALQRSSTFYPEGADRDEPTSLNQKYHTDEFWGDSMPAALSGHPGAYYTTVMGGEVGAQYTAQAIVSPPNDARFWNQGNFLGMLDYLGHNVGTFGSGNPDKFTALDFDNHNLDFLLVSSELYAYNDEPYYTYLEDPALIEALFDAEPEYALDQIKSRDSYLFRQNTLGYLTKKIRQASNGNLTTIKATCVDGQPQYIFTTGEDIVPKSALFQPLIVSPERYEELESRGLVDGYIIVDVQASSLASTQSIDTRGIDSNKLTTEEKSLYSAKIPLADIFGGFDYPIKSIEVFGINDDQVIDSHLLTTSEYNVSLGNLYFTKSLEELIPIFANYKLYYKMFGGDTLPQECYYKFVIHVAKIVPDDGSEETARNALNIATTYEVMDYFDQYTFAQTSAQMIAEIGYTEIMTITSTAISAPVVALGSYAAKAAQEATAVATKTVVGATSGAAQHVGQHATKFALKSLIFEIGKRVVIGTIKETIEEIVVDGFFETAIQSAVRMSGGSAAAGHWISTLFTSVRETANFGYLTGSRGSNAQGFAGQVQRAMGLSTKFESIVSQMKAKNEKMSVAQIAAANEQFLTAQMAEIGILDKTVMESKITLGRILATGIFTGLSLLAPSLVGFNLYAISRLVGGIGTKIDAKIQNKFLAARNSMMLSKDAEPIEKPKVELGKKPIDTQSDDNLPNVEAQVSLVPNVLNPLMARNPVEFALSGASYFSVFGFKDGRPVTHHQVIQEAINEEIKRKAMLIGQSEKKVIALGGGITAQGDLKQTLEAIKDKYNFDQFAKISDTLTKYYEAIHTGKAISDIEGIYDARAYHILGYISEKINNDEMLNGFEEDALDLIIDIMKSAQGSYKNIYQGLFSREAWKKIGKPKGIPSGVAPFYKIFLSKIAKTLYRNGVINSDPDAKLIESVKELTVAIGRSQYNIWNRLSEIESGTSFGASEDFLSRIYVSLENLISSCLPKSVSYDVINALQQDFDFLCFVQGDMSKNKFYGEARLLIYKIIDIISGATIPNYGGTITSLDRDVLIGVKVRGMYENIKDAREPPSLGIVANLRTSIIDNLVPHITSAQLDKILYLVDNFKESIISYQGVIDLLSTYKDSYRKSLVKDLINSKITPILQQCCSINSLSDLLFGDSNELPHIFFKDINSRSRLYILQHIRLRVSLWTTEDFKSEGHIDQATLDLLIEEVNDKIDRFISGEKFFEYFLKGQVSVYQAFYYLNKRYVRSGYENEQDVIQAFHHAVAAFTGNSKTTLEDLSNMIGLSQLDHASAGHRFSVDTFKKMVSFIEKIIKDDTNSFIFPMDPKYDFISRLTLDQCQDIYENAKKTIQKYMKEFGMERPKNWNDENVEAYHIFKLLKRNLGMEILSFTTLDKSIFIKIKGKIQNFARHHFRNDFFRKLSNYVQDLILTDNKNHKKYESYSEAQMLVILNGFDKMMEMEDSVSRNDVINIFRKNEWVLYGLDRESGKDGWFNSEEGFDNMLKEFNDRKNLLKNEGLAQFIREKYDTVYERFYRNLPDGTANADGFYSLVTPHPWFGDYAMWIDMFDGFWLPDF